MFIRFQPQFVDWNYNRLPSNYVDHRKRSPDRARIRKVDHGAFYF
jgi:hypothetical protein